MLNKPAQKKLALFLSAMTLLNVYLLFKGRHNIELGLPDFTSSYTAAIILRHGLGNNLYDLRLQDSVQRTVVPISVEKRGAALPYNHPPFEAVVFWPLAYFSYAAAYWIWFAVNLGLLGTTIVVWRKTLPKLRALPFYLWVLASLSFAPVFIALLQGQDSILLLWCFSMAIVAIHRNSKSGIGVWLGFGLFKFHIVLPFLLPFIFLRRKTVLTAFATVALFLTLFGWIAVGWKAVSSYPGFLWSLNRNPQISPLVTSGGTPTLHGLIASVTFNHPGIGFYLLLLFSFGLVTISIKIWEQSRQSDLQQQDLIIAANVIIALLLSYHLWAHDMSLLLLPTFLLAEVTISERHFRCGSKHLIWISIAILSSTPVTFILLSYHKLYVMSIVMLGLLATLSLEILRSGSTESPQTGPRVPSENPSLNL